MLCRLRGMGRSTSTTSQRAWVPSRYWLRACQVLIACQHSTLGALVPSRRVDGERLEAVKCIEKDGSVDCYLHVCFIPSSP
jgi:hypothetical protein